MFKSIRKDIFIFLIISFGFSLRLILQNQIAVNLDNIAYYYPVFDYIKESFLNNKLPFWNPHIVCGYPLIAVPNNLPFLNVIFGLKLSQIMDNSIKIFAYLVFMYLYLRMLKLSRFAVFVGILILMVVLKASSLVYLFPAAFYFVEKMIQEKNIRSAIWPGLILALSFLTGHPQYNLYLCYALGLYVCVRVFYERGGSKTVIRIFSYFLLALLLMFLLSAVQILPSYEMMKLSNRMEGLTFRESVGNTSIPPWQTISFLLPNTFGNYYNGTEWAGTNFGLGLYIGISGLVFLVLAILKERKNIYVLTFIIIGVGSFLLSMGKYTPLYRVAYYILPGFNLFRGANRIVCLFNLAAAVLCAFGTDYFFKRIATNISVLRKIQKIFLRSTLISVTLLIIFILLRENLLSLGKYIIETCIYGKAGHPFNESFYTDKLSALYRLNAIGIAKFVAVVMAVYLTIIWYLRKKNTFVLKAITLSIICGDLLLAGVTFDKQLPVTMMGEPRVYNDTPQCIDYLKRDNQYFRIMTLGGSIPANLSMRYGLYNVKGYEALYIWRYYNFWNKLVMKDCAYERDFSEVWRSLIGFDENEKITDYNKKMIDLLGVKYLLSPTHIVHSELDLVHIASETANTKPLLLPNAYSNSLLLEYKRKEIAYYPDTVVYNKKIYIYKNTTSLPIASLVNDFEVAKSEDEAIAKLKQSDFNPRSKVLLEEPVNINIEQERKSNPIEKSVAIVTYKPGSIQLSVDTPQASFLVISEAWYPGWQAYVDKHKTKIYKANYAFKAVVVPSGKHTIMLSYTPFYFLCGLYMTLGSFFISISILIFNYITKKKHN